VSTSRKILLAKRPVEMFTDACFEVVEAPVPEPGEGEAVVQIEYLSLDPAMRGWVRDEPSYLPPVQLGEVMRSGAAGRVVASNNPSLPVGTAVMGLLGWCEHAVIGGATGAMVNPLPEGVELVDSLSLFGSTGVTAYFGVLDVGELKAGETLVVSGAAGGVGSIAGQIGKIVGCRVVGIAGTKEKCSWVVDELGFDACIDYRTENVADALREACPNGIDVYFDNVGGDILDAALQNMNDFGRLVECGMISRYNDAELAPGPRNMGNIVTRRLRMQGFIVIDYLGRFMEAAMQLAVWAAEGKLKNRVHVVDGFLSAPTAVNMLFTGENIGKLVVKI
jgi:NADPH-dependent curcumin reductase CurA